MISKFFRNKNKVRGEVSTISPLIINYIDKNSLKAFIFEWNNIYPFDRWWREKYNIPFNSEHHRKMNIIDMRLEYEEDIIYKKLRTNSDYKLNSGDYMKEETEENLTEEEKLKRFKEECKDLDLSKYDD